MEQYCRETADLTIDLRPGINRLNDPADVRDLLQLNIRIAKEQLRRGTYPGDVLKDISSLHQHLSLALGRYTSSGVKHRKNHKAPRQSDRLVMTRDEWIRKRVGALLDQGMELTRASKSVEQELSKLVANSTAWPSGTGRFATSAVALVSASVRAGLFQKKTEQLKLLGNACPDFPLWSGNRL